MLTTKLFIVLLVAGIILIAGCVSEKKPENKEPIPESKTKTYTTATYSSENFPIVKNLESININNSENFPKELEVSDFRFTISDAKFNITADGKKIYLLINIEYPDNEISKVWGRTEVVDTICDIVFDQGPTATCAPIHGILIDRQTSKEFNGQPVYIHNTDNLIQITEIGYMPSSKTWSYFVLSGIERHEVYKTLDKVLTPPEGTNYIVIVNSNSVFRSEAERFANKKNAGLLTYSQNFNEVMGNLKNKKPSYTAIFATPEELTPDFIDNIDLSLRNIDDDPYLDAAFGIITSRNTAELKKYVDRLLNYVPPQKMKIYAVAPKYTYTDLKKDFSISIMHNCLTNCGGAYCICDDENRATLQRIEEGFSNSNIVIMDVHGSPESMMLDNGEILGGSTEGLIAKKPTSEVVCEKGSGGTDICGPKMIESPLKTNTNLLIAESCTTGRINGLPSKIYSAYGDYDVKGEIDASVVLSFLQSGVLNYIAATHVANTAILPEETIIEESFLKRVPIGIALKDLKNRYIMVTESYKVAMPGKPVNTDEFTKDFILFQVRNWVLFGDPSIVLSNEEYVPINCIKSYTEEQIGNKKEVELQIKFRSDRLVENSQYIDRVEKVIGQEWGQLGVGVCVAKIPYTGKLKELKVTSVSGVNENYQNGEYPANAFYQDLGGEIFVQVPWYVAIGGKSHVNPIVIKYEITTE